MRAALFTALLCFTTVSNVAHGQGQQPKASKKTEVTTSLTGTLYRADNAEPVGRQWISLSRNKWSKSTTTDTFGRFNLEQVPPGPGYTLSFWHNGYKNRSFGPFTVKEKQSKPLVWRVQPVDAQVVPYTYSDTYLPGQNITVMVRSIRVPAVNVDVFKYSIREVLDRKSQLLDRKSLSIPATKKPYLSYRQPVNGGHQLRWRTTRVEPAFNTAGLYVVRVSGGQTSKLIPIIVTQLSLITKRMPGALWVWATDLETGKPMPKVKIIKEGLPTSRRRSLKTRADGLAQLRGPFTKNQRLWGLVGQNLAYIDTRAPSAAQSLAFRAYVYTDRPAYRPLGAVNYKVVVRANQNGTYRVRPGESWEVVVRDPEGEVVYRQDHKTSLFGTFSGQLKLGESPALGMWSVQARSGDRVQSGRFKVLEYRKPNYKLHVSTKQSQFVQGQTIEAKFSGNYYFGAPLAGKKLNYTVYETRFRPWWYDSYYGDYSGDSASSYGYGSVAQSGTVTLDATGNGVARINVDRASIDRWVTIEAVISDESGQQVSARKKVMVTRGSFRVGIKPRGRIFKVGETAKFDIDVSRFDGKPRQRTVTVSASLERFSKKHRIWLYETLSRKKVQTDVTGKAIFPFKLKRDGFVRFEVSGDDDYGNPIVQSTFVWATKGGSVAGGYKKKSLDILTDKKRYKPGDIARVLLNTTRANAWVLFSTEGDGFFSPQVVKVRGNSHLFEVPISKKHSPNVHLAVAFAADKQFYSLQKSVAVSPVHRLLNIDITSDKAIYEPGQKAKYNLKVTDARGRPVRAELSLALVDSAIYAVSRELTPTVKSFFYGHRPNPVTTAYSFPSRYLGGADKDGDGGERVRRDFKDTAYWNAVVHTDAQGHAKVDVPLPDNLTSWRLTVRAVTKDTLVGQKLHVIKTAKPLMSTIALPRFFRHGDNVEVVTMLHNRGEDLNGVVATLEVGGAVSLSKANKRIVSLAGGTSMALRWPLKVNAKGNEAVVRVRVSSGSLSDSEERKIPVFPLAVEQRAGVSGMTGVGTEQVFSLPQSTVNGTTRLSLRVMPSMAAAAVESLEDLAEFPYGCVEQTMNTFLPDLVLSRVLKSLKLKRPGKLASLPAMVRKGLRRLYDMQHDDGGWGWWSDDATHPFMTGYVVYGLVRAQKLGFAVRKRVLEKGIKSAIAQFKHVSDPNTRAFLLYAVANGPPSKQRDAFIEGALEQVTKSKDKLNAYSLATLILAQVAAGKGAAVKALADTLANRAVVQGDVAYFPGRSWRYSWTDNANEATAYALRALLAVHPGHGLVPKAMRWLMAKRRGGMWDTTKDTAAAVEALAELMVQSNELSSNYTAKFVINGRSVGQMIVNPKSVLSQGLTIDVPSDLLKTGNNKLQIGLDGHGMLYWTGALTYGLPPKSSDKGITVQREYFKLIQAKSGKGLKTSYQPVSVANLKMGDQVEVRVHLTTPRAYEYLAVEDPLPAGFEVLPGGKNRHVAKREVRDEKVAFFATRLPKGKHTIKYQMRAEVSGNVTATPTTAWLMYMPSVAGNGGAFTFVVGRSPK